MKVFWEAEVYTLRDGIGQARGVISAPPKNLKRNENVIEKQDYEAY